MPKPQVRSAALLPLKGNWFHVLLSLAECEQHGYGIMQEVLARTDGKIRLWPATLYGTLRRLLEEELIDDVSSLTPAQRTTCAAATTG
jgi:DNA-binding PadR family transcriptional regulator